MDSYEKNKSEIIFVTGCLTRGYAAGVIVAENMAEEISMLRAAWREGWAEHYVDEPVPLPAELAESFKRDVLEAPPEAAPASMAASYANEKLDFGNKMPNITFGELALVAPKSQEAGYLKWMVSSVKPRDEKQRIMLSRVKAVLEHINTPDKTPF